MPKVNIITVREFNDAATDRLRSEFRAAHSTGQELVPVIIDSPGGYLHSLFAMIDIFDNSYLPVATVVNGKAFSAGFVLAACGAPGLRFASPNSRLMMHSVLGGHGGTAEAVENQAKEMRFLNKQMYKILSSHTGKTVKEIEELFSDNKYTDVFMSPRKAKQLKFIDHIGMPHLEVSVDMSTRLNMEK
jgi:ATP-dependent Clp protease protease subunit